MSRLTLVVATCFLLVSAQAQAIASGHVRCTISENGEGAQGTLRLSQNGRELARGACGGDALAIAPGDYVAVVQLDGALDGPEQQKSVTVHAGQTAEVSAAFATGTLEVRIQNDGRRAAGMALIRRDGTQIGTLGSGVSAHLSAGTYDVIARYRDQEQRFAGVVIKAGEKQVIEVAFGSTAKQ